MSERARAIILGIVIAFAIAGAAYFSMWVVALDLAYYGGNP